MRRIWLLVGPSGSGKTTVGQWMNTQGIKELVSHTTREPRPGEVPGVTYYYCSKGEFDVVEKIEETVYAGNYYCLSKKEVEDKLSGNQDVFTVVDCNGAEQIKEKYPEETRVIFVFAPKHLLIQRMQARGDKMEAIVSRIENITKTNEINKGLALADYCIVNRNSKVDTLRQLKGILHYCN